MKKLYTFSACIYLLGISYANAQAPVDPSIWSTTGQASIATSIISPEFAKVIQNAYEHRNDKKWVDGFCEGVRALELSQGMENNGDSLSFVVDGHENFTFHCKK